MRVRRIVMIGDGGHGKVVRELIALTPNTVLAAVLDDRYAAQHAGRGAREETGEDARRERRDAHTGAAAAVSPGNGGNGGDVPEDGVGPAGAARADGECRLPVSAWRSLRDRYPSLEFVVAIGDNRARHRIVRELEAAGARFVRLIHPAAVVSPRARIGPGAVVMARAVIQPDASIGAHAIVNTGAIVEHDCAVGDCAHIAPGAVLTGGAGADEGALVGAGAVILPGRKVGAWAIAGAGAVVTRDVPPECTAAGVPAAVIRRADPAPVSAFPQPEPHESPGFRKPEPYPASSRPATKTRGWDHA